MTQSSPGAEWNAYNSTRMSILVEESRFAKQELAATGSLMPAVLAGAPICGNTGRGTPGSLPDG